MNKTEVFEILCMFSASARHHIPKAVAEVVPITRGARELLNKLMN